MKEKQYTTAKRVKDIHRNKGYQMGGKWTGWMTDLQKMNRP